MCVSNWIRRRGEIVALVDQLNVVCLITSGYYGALVVFVNRGPGLYSMIRRLTGAAGGVVSPPPLVPSGLLIA